MLFGYELAMKKLELITFLKKGKSKELKLTLQDLEKILQIYSTSIFIDELEESSCFSIIIRWESVVQMQRALKMIEFKILSGAINSLCEKTIIRLDDVLIGNHISKLKDLLCRIEEITETDTQDNEIPRQ